ncbi:hypothetical protein C343_02380 [Cryptococcus neoformans C23]|uniref:Integral membrane protein n=2 Tax=Cryptococcus neoformans TaxID=5207 RepID=A0A854QG54_CRYNE|nr:hypothetical protein CNAG_05044 [Cryptococcus neoformans var. grubii H99]AUB23949.1 hypothetical protein CKF44_05044 [Cryptococcus neoformans var. grubii]OWZ33427.1 hypothetical protein C347_02448 [Cryptococcus neoformans var. grubii AD2-60a]OWZ45523.1 hypothetical protein C343_02380 [Cryptococcus neoformans var. grubii C23]OWZ47816.1 hypothetical protein C353_02282 [Cryptococcus neoformans var. grubii AD1-83a]OWZ55072.1 hypothetical protein C368_02869 [Cryptococcus neoformans var. grubii 1|eukprot:XP_012048684.1 hypothetical protein CNAG_05044 [Cryptococcus neoformans var. grubii H99]
MGNGLSSALDPTEGKGVISVPDGYTTPPWPSLYLPTLDSTVEQRGIFLYEAEAIWRFTLYWTILLVCSLFLICALMASFTLLLSLTVFRSPDPLSPAPKPHDSRSNETPPYRTTSPNTGASATSSSTPLVKHPRPFERPKRKKPPFWPVILLPIVMAVVAGIVSIISSTIIGFALAAVYSAGGFSMSTWVPFLWALIQALVLVISSYSTLTTIL